MRKVLDFAKFKNQITLLLSTLLFLVFLQPPIQINKYKLFLSDFWNIFLLSFVFLAAPAGWLSKSLKKCILISGLILLISSLHGIFRPSLLDLFTQNSLIIADNDQYNFLKELFNAFRFFTWFSLLSIFAFYPNWVDLNKIRKILVFIFCIIIFSLITYSINSETRSFYGNLYQYNPNYLDWMGRAHGVFSSPVEAGIATLLLGLLLISTEIKKAYIYIFSFLSLLSIFLTRSGTAAAALMLSISFIMFIKHKNFSRIKITVWFSAILFLTIIVATNFDSIWENNPILRGKILNLIYRIKPWSVYLYAAVKRLDLLLFGYGFVPYHADNSFLFLLNRGGLFLLFGMILAIFKFVQLNIKIMNIWQLHVIIFLLISCFTVDLLIYRHVIAILIAFGIPFLATKV